MSILEYMRNEHRECDTFFANAEKEVAEGNWEEAIKQFDTFTKETLTHFKKEEDELFPTFEEVTGHTQGPTRVMRYEHDQVRGLMEKMAEALSNKDKDAYLSLGESMMILLQQHNMKEEQMLYAMCDNVIPEAIKEVTLESMENTTL